VTEREDWKSQFPGHKDLQVVDAIFYGLAPAVMAIVLHAVIRIGKKALKNTFMVALAAAFLGIFVFKIPFPFIIIAAGLIGFIGGRLRPETFVVIKMHEADLMRFTCERTIRYDTRTSSFSAECALVRPISPLPAILSQGP